MKPYKLIVFAALMVLMGGCAATPGQSTDLPASTPSPVSSPTSLLPTQTVSPTSTAIPSTQEASPSPTTGSTSGIVYQCLRATDGQDGNFPFAGALVLANNWFFSTVNILNLEGGAQLIGPLWEGDRSFSLAISPDGRMMAYLAFNAEQNRQELRVITADQEELLFEEVPTDFSKILNWLADNRLAISRTRLDENGSQLLDSTIIFDLFSGDQTELLPTYPNFNSPIRPIVQWLDRYYNRTVYDPSLTRVVYAGLSDGDTPVLLADIQTMQILGQVNRIGGLYGSTPQWTQDGQRVAISAAPQLNQIDSPEVGIELFSLTRDGQFSRLSYLTESYPAIIYNFSWSPDGGHIAFWVDLQDDSQPGVQLAVLNVETGLATSYCIVGVRVEPGSEDFVPPVWSPDGQHIAVASIGSDGESHITVVISLTEQLAVEVGQDSIPMGWLANP